MRLTSIPFRELIAPQAQGCFRDRRRKTDDGERGQGRVTLTFVRYEFRCGYSVSPHGLPGRYLALSKQALKSEKNRVLFSEPASYGCDSVLFQGAGQ
jgi:hypothetical protein